MVKTINKIAYLDGIRGIASFLVFFHHFLLAFYVAFYSFNYKASNLYGWDVKYGKSLFSVISNGDFCVCIFFVLSGFVLSRSYFQTNKFELLVSGGCRRFLRLYIPVAFTMVIAYLMMRGQLFFNVPVSVLRHSEWWLGGLWTFDEPFTKLWNCLRADTMFKGDASFDTSLWTMAIEFSGSLFVFSFLALTHKTRRKLFSLFLVFMYCYLTEQTMLACFVFGISLNYVEKQNRLQYGRSVNLIAIPLLLLSLVLGAYPSSNTTNGTFFENLSGFLLENKMWFRIFGAYFFVLSFVLSKQLQKLVSLQLFRFLGYVSFSLYLLHPLVIGSFSSYLFLKLYQRLGFNYSVIYIFILTTIVCLSVAWLMTKYIDNPGIKFSKYVYKKWFKKVEVPENISAPENEKVLTPNY